MTISERNRTVITLVRADLLKAQIDEKALFALYAMEHSTHSGRIFENSESFGNISLRSGIVSVQGEFSPSMHPLVFLGEFAMKTVFHLVIAGIVGVATIGCEPKSTTEKKSETTVTTPGGETTTTVKQKVETTPDSATKTTTEKVEKTGDNPPLPSNP